MASYDVEGYLLEACSCAPPCPCWIGDDADGGKCDAFNGYRIQKGSIKGIDVAGATFAFAIHIPGNVLKGNWKIVFFLSDRLKPDQRQAILDAWTGKLGGPLADLAKLVGEVRGVYDAPIEFQLEKGKGMIRVGTKIEAEMAPYTDRDGRPTTLVNTVFSNIPGSPAYVAKATSHRVNIPEHGMQWSFQNRNAIQGSFRFVG